MRARQPKVVKPVRVDLENERVWQGDRGLRLTPKAFSVLRCLVEHTGRLVTKEALFKTAWPGRVVSDDALSTCICEIRKVLGDAARAPQYLETVHRRGYRFIATVSNIVPGPTVLPLSSTLIPHSPLVGRTRARPLHGYLNRRAGVRARSSSLLVRRGLGRRRWWKRFSWGLGTGG